ncbi:tyrosine-type recombinase/integrase [Anaerofilum sp. BX8]|uniref:Tyrosine-type recombinase/integrase n=1 Tax=Anaerofilum hominis TaxID=2763016 RepID=A0A923L082_9FIRM|nr:tyrosine-type recombinase/integrase [Anaerofilum hominis]MBC5579995.1 tyrosine-type recombinase/integrase [Anaerofilum hominis]
MNGQLLDIALLESFRDHLVREERSSKTVEKYVRDARAFYFFLPPDKWLTKERVMDYKAHVTENYKTASANSMLVAVNRFLAFLGCGDCQVKLLKVQRANFRHAEKELSKEEYRRLLAAAQNKKNERLYLLMQTLCSTGLRVSEHRFVTAQALREGAVRVRSKGKERVVFLPPELIRQLRDYCARRRISAGPVFVTRTGRVLDRSNIWAEMKRLCLQARVAAQKVFPHNLRHLFALTYYRLKKDIVRLADVLGHSSVETTRIYTATTGREEKRLVSRLGLLARST